MAQEFVHLPLESPNMNPEEYLSYHGLGGVREGGKLRGTAVKTSGLCLKPVLMWRGSYRSTPPPPGPRGWLVNTQRQPGGQLAYEMGPARGLAAGWGGVGGT